MSFLPLAMETTVFFSILFGLLVGGAHSESFQFLNNCTYPVWAATLSGGGSPALPQTGFLLSPGASASLPSPPSWSGRFWGRTHCSTDPATARFSCATGDCATGRIPCAGSGGTPPATLAEITLGSATALDFYDVSMVDGFNLPLALAPLSGGCRPAGCARDVNALCPPELRVVGADGRVVACRSACQAFGDPAYCCTGAYGGPGTCKPSNYSKVFKSACPAAYSYAYDDATSTFTCSSDTYIVTFCPALSTFA